MNRKERRRLLPGPHEDDSLWSGTERGVTPLREAIRPEGLIPIVLWEVPLECLLFQCAWSRQQPEISSSKWKKLYREWRNGR